MCLLQLRGIEYNCIARPEYLQSHPQRYVVLRLVVANSSVIEILPVSNQGCVLLTSI